MPRVVRIGRAANDNLRRSVPWLRALAVAIAAALLVYALCDRGLI